MGCFRFQSSEGSWQAVVCEVCGERNRQEFSKQRIKRAREAHDGIGRRKDATLCRGCTQKKDEQSKDMMKETARGQAVQCSVCRCYFKHGEYSSSQRSKSAGQRACKACAVGKLSKRHEEWQKWQDRNLRRE